MRRFAYLLSLLIFFASPASAQLSVTGVGGAFGGAVSTFTGPIDVVSIPTACYSLRACSAAIAAAGTQQMVNIRRASDNETCDVIVATSGGTGLTANCSGSDNNKSTATFCNATSCFVAKWYDQTGDGFDAPQATAGSQPQFILSGIGSLPSIRSNGSQNFSTVTMASGASNTVSVVGQRSGGFTSFQQAFGWYNNNVAYSAGWQNAANSWQSSNGNGGQIIIGTAADSAFHSIQTVFSGASSDINIDGTRTTGTITASTSSASRIFITANGVSAMTGDLTEIVFYNFTFSSTQEANMCHNQYTYWGTSTSC